jgi:hypothetical protein
MMMFSGAVSLAQKPACPRFVHDDPERILEFIAFVSLLAKLLNQAKQGGPPNPRRRCRSRWQSTLSAPGPPHVRWLAGILASVLCMAYTARPELCKAEGSCSTS